jgi:hypothetical protein
MQFAKEGGQRSCPRTRFYPASLRASRDCRPRDPHYNSSRFYSPKRYLIGVSIPLVVKVPS